MRNYTIKMKRFILICAIGLSFLFSGIILEVQSEDEAATIIVDPAYSQIGIQDSFTIGIKCTPSEAMKSFEFRISYDTNLLTATEVREGDIFQGYETFFNNGTINDDTGIITNIYGLILGSGNITNSGTLIWIDFTSHQTFGQTTITLSKVGITDEEMYLPVTIIDGVVEIVGMNPSIEQVSTTFSNPLDSDPTIGWYQINCNVIDDNIDTVKVEIHYPKGIVTNETMTYLSSDSYAFQGPCDGHGMYQYHIFAIDSSGNTDLSRDISFIIPANWDVNNDGGATVLDFTHISNKIGSTGEPGWIREDVNNNGLVSLSDMVMVSNYYNQKW